VFCSFHCNVPLSEWIASIASIGEFASTPAAALQAPALALNTHSNDFLILLDSFAKPLAQFYIRYAVFSARLSEAFTRGGQKKDG